VIQKGLDSMYASHQNPTVAMILTAALLISGPVLAQSPVSKGATYAIVNSNSGKVADLAGGSMAADATVLQYTYHATPNQQWTAYPAGNGYWEFANAKSGMCMSVGGDHTSLGDAIVQTTYIAKPEQQWKLLPYTDGTYYLVNRVSGMVLDVSGGATDDGAKIQQWTNGAFKNQRWTLKPIASFKP